MSAQVGLNWDPVEGRRVEVLHWDGRIDNRDDLLFLLRDRLQGDISNSALARAVYERDGTAGFVRLIGDWSLVIRDHANRVIVLASDFAGVRPLYYSIAQGRVVWSNRLSAIVREAGTGELDDEYLRGFLLFGGCPNRTPYRNIYSVPPGYSISASSDRTTIRRFWEMPVKEEIHYNSEIQYEEHLRHLFREAVSVRLQAPSPVLAELSGGLDSSSVVTMANHLIRAGATRTSRLTGLSYLWKNSLDEPFVREVESFCGIEGVHISTQDVPLISATQVGDASPEILQPVRTMVAEAARQLNVKTILTGMNGDLVSGNWFDDSLQVARPLRRLRIDLAFVEALAWSKIVRRPVYSVLSRALRAALPPSLVSTAIYDAPDGAYAPMCTETSLLCRNCDRRSSSASHFFSNGWMAARPERRKHFHALSALLELRTLQAPEPLQHLDFTHPFAHRPLVEFLMAVPPAVLCRPGEPRRLMRSAMSNLWPPKVRTRRSKGLFNAPWQEALRPLARTLLRDRHLQLVDRGFVDQASVSSRLERLSLGLECNEAQLRHIVLLEFWLRGRARNGMPTQVSQAA